VKLDQRVRLIRCARPCLDKAPLYAGGLPQGGEPPGEFRQQVLLFVHQLWVSHRGIQVVLFILPLRSRHENNDQS
jgi:hypothetical protein